MCFRNKNKPVRLYKKKQNETLENIKLLMKQPEFWLIITIILLFIFLIWFALHESEMFFVYNRGGI